MEAPVMATMNVSLPGPMKEGVECQTEGSRYSNASDYGCDPIRRDRERAAQMAAMQARVAEGLDSGVGDRTMDELRAAARAQTAAPRLWQPCRTPGDQRADPGRRRR
jgi:antitoxin ParD1/3/4